MEKNFFQKLFSTKFDVFITPSIASIVYIIVLALTGVGVVGATLAGLSIGEVSALLIPLGGLLFVIIVRSLLETSVALIKIAENTKKD